MGYIDRDYGPRESFPDPHPLRQDPHQRDLHRDPTSGSMFSQGQGGEVQYAEFPVPAPAQVVGHVVR
jgi:hypothetical protein